MKRQDKYFSASDDDFIIKSLLWAQSFPEFHYFNPNSFSDYPFGSFKHFIGAGAMEKVVSNKNNSFEDLTAFSENRPDWLLGHFSYDLKNQIEKLHSKHQGTIDFPDLYFYVPETLLFFDRPGEVKISSYQDPDKIYRSILLQQISDNSKSPRVSQPVLDKQEYLNTIHQIRKHIIDGDFYEMNYCVSFTFDEVALNPISEYMNLCKFSPMPFSSLMKYEGRYVLCASPERFLRKTGRKLISQPIKGTTKKGATRKEDLLLRQNLYNSEKERAENLMIVDLVRNDLARSSRPGTVKVEELFGIYGFERVNQMISTISSELRDDISIVQCIKNAFPMGSMTGAPKIRVMEMIEKYENFKRGLFSGSIGYIEPNKDFDFNVVIRSIFYDINAKVLNWNVGSAITFDSKPEMEYEECLLKASSILGFLNEENE